MNTGTNPDPNCGCAPARSTTPDRCAAAERPAPRTLVARPTDVGSGMRRVPDTDGRQVPSTCAMSFTESSSVDVALHWGQTPPPVAPRPQHPGPGFVEHHDEGIRVRVQAKRVVRAPLGHSHAHPDPRTLRDPAIAEALGIEDPPAMAGLQRDVAHGRHSRRPAAHPP